MTPTKENPMKIGSVVPFFTLFFTLICLACDPAIAERVPQLKWEMLIPPTPPLENFLEQIPPEQQEALSDIDYWKSYPSGQLEAELAYQRDEAKKYVDADRKKFARKGVDIDALYVRYLEWMAEIDRRGKLTQKKYDGKRVAIAGYLLPLDFNPEGTSEFLLVPYVGACIHVPPPPSNQVIYVKSAALFQVSDLFEGVLVIGKMKVEAASKDLTFIDGASNVDSSYFLESESIKLYHYEEEGAQ
jgi:hypothetical protein